MLGLIRLVFRSNIRLTAEKRKKYRWQRGADTRISQLLRAREDNRGGLNLIKEVALIDLWRKNWTSLRCKAAHGRNSISDRLL